LWLKNQEYIVQTRQPYLDRLCHPEPAKDLA
jgi:hypothetical protein